MDKLIPDPPVNTSEAEEVLKDREATKRALDFYLNPPDPNAAKPRRPSTMSGIDTESLLAHAYESLASASVMISDFANNLSGPQRNTALGIQQIVM